MTKEEKRAASRRWYWQNRDTERARAKEHARKRYAENPQLVKAQALAWKKRNPEKAKQIIREWRARKLYGLTDAEYRAMLARPCTICGDQSQAVDHDHETGEVRGPLCRPCNQGLGHFRDNPALLRGAVEYLEGVLR